MEIIVGILSGLVLLLAFTTYNLMRKNEKAEDIINSYQEYHNKIRQTIDYSEKKFEELDHRGVFKSDDEIGWFYKSVKELQETISQFK